eukprot:5621999-Karenia_brevis.AAC.1
MQQEQSALLNGLRYALAVWTCAAHIGNLTVSVAIVGDWVANPARNDELVGNCIRWFKYLVCDYAEEFAFSLRKYLEGAVQCVDRVADTAAQ